LSTQRRSATKRKQSGKRSGRSAQPVPKTVQTSSPVRSSATAVTRERSLGTTVPRERSPGTTVTYRPREAVTNDAVAASPPTRGSGSTPTAAVVRDARKERSEARRKPAIEAAQTAAQPRKKLIDLDRFKAARGRADPPPPIAPGRRRKARAEAEQPKGRTLVNTDRFDGVRQFSRDTWSEIKKVNWPDRETTRNLTLVVIAVSAILGVMLGGIDYVLFQLFEALP